MQVFATHATGLQPRVLLATKPAAHRRLAIRAGKLARDRGQPAEAQQVFEQALAIYGALGMKARMREVREQLAALETEALPAAAAHKAPPQPKRRWWQWWR